MLSRGDEEGLGKRFCKLLEPIPKDVYSVGSNEMLI